MPVAGQESPEDIHAKKAKLGNQEADEKDVPGPALQKRHDEYQYLDLVRHIINHGKRKGDRTGTGTLSVPGGMCRYSLRDGAFPLLTTKRVFWRGVVEELLWFIHAGTNSNDLARKSVHIWDKNGSKEFLEKEGFTHRNQGDLGPIYGFQWRHCGADYKSMSHDYEGMGIDQLQEVIDTIKTNPDSRRIIMSAWNVVDIPKMVLPPCHCFVQFTVEQNELTCILYQRSADMGLGVPFNIASYALLTYMIASVTGTEPGELVHMTGDTHVYLNHVEPLHEQLKRTPREFPKLLLKRQVESIDEFVAADFELKDYNPHPKIQMEMSV